MALKGLDIFKLSPKKNCKECGSPTCMAFCMKVAQGAISIDKCPYFSDDAKAMLNEATAPAMKTITFGKDHKLGGETVMFRHEKTLVNKNLYSVPVSTAMTEEEVDAKLAALQKVDYERIGERMYVETGPDSGVLGRGVRQGRSGCVQGLGAHSGRRYPCQLGGYE